MRIRGPGDATLSLGPAGPGHQGTVSGESVGCMLTVHIIFREEVRIISLT